MSSPHDKQSPRTEHASDLWTGADLEKHYTRPLAMVGRVEYEPRDGDGRPYHGLMSGEILVRLVNGAEDEPRDGAPIAMALGYPYVATDDPDTERGDIIDMFGAAMFEPSTARALARYLWEAADRAEGRRVAGCSCGSSPRMHSGVGWYQLVCECGMRSPVTVTAAAAFQHWHSMTRGS